MYPGMLGRRGTKDGLEVVQHLLLFGWIDGQIHVQQDGMRGVGVLYRGRTGTRRRRAWSSNMFVRFMASPYQ